MRPKVCADRAPLLARLAQCCASRKSQSPKFFDKFSHLATESGKFFKWKVKVDNVGGKVSHSKFGNFQKCSQNEEEKMSRKSLDTQRPLAGWREPEFYHLYRPLAAKMATWEKIFHEICETLVKSWGSRCDSQWAGGQWRLRKGFQMARPRKRPKLAGTQMVSRKFSLFTFSQPTNTKRHKARLNIAEKKLLVFSLHWRCLFERPTMLWFSKPPRQTQPASQSQTFIIAGATFSQFFKFNLAFDRQLCISLDQV